MQYENLFEDEELSEINLKKLLNRSVGYNKAEKPWLNVYNKINEYTDEPKWVE